MFESFYFGDESQALLGHYHPPEGVNHTDYGIVLCYPMGQEYIRCHRAFYILACKLSMLGFHTIRFDYYGCGDSYGHCDEGTIQHWQEDIKNAINELQKGVCLNNIILIGLRLGATLCALEASENNDVKGLVLWDPVISGKHYLTEIINTHNIWLKGSFSNKSNDNKDEVLGFSLSNTLKKDLAILSLETLKHNSHTKTLVINTIENSANINTNDYFSTLFSIYEYKYLSSSPVWIKDKNKQFDCIVPSETINYITSWLEMFN